VVMGLLGTESRSELAVIGQAANLASRLQDLTKVPLTHPEHQPLFGAFTHSLGICLPEYVTNHPDFRNIELPEQINIRDFSNIRNISVING
ncbi:MAG: hypothetical protein HQM12_23820, partial [SAR324 cluster bacterium]|nr:hypothetical protein [SAR324 cluster bacterium]